MQLDSENALAVQQLLTACRVPIWQAHQPLFASLQGPLEGYRLSAFPVKAGAANVVLLLEEPTPLKTVLRAEYGLTQREAQVAELIMQAKAPAQAAALLGIGVGTIRNHLKQVLLKTGVHRQADLVRLRQVLTLNQSYKLPSGEA